MLSFVAVLMASIHARTAQDSGPEPAVHSLFGTSVAGLGDIDADGVPDFLIADPDESGPGRVWAISGKTNRVLYARDGVESGDYFGWRLRAVGDVNGDGIADWIAGCDGPWALDEDRPSFASVHSGRDGTRLYLIRSSDLEEGLGRCFAGAGDIDEDGRDDLVIGARRTTSSEAVAYLYSGRSGERLRAIGSGADLGTSAIDVASLGDCDGDCVPDFLVALEAPIEQSSPVPAVTLFSGATGEPRWRFETKGVRDITQVRLAGDVDGDGWPDALLSGLGGVLLLSGRNGKLIRSLEPAPPFVPDEHFKSSMESLENVGFGSAIAILRNPSGSMTLAVGAGEFACGNVYYLGLSSGFRAPSFPTPLGLSLSHLGLNVDNAGDLDGDGWDDLLCATFGKWGGADGLALVYSGSDGHELRRFARQGDSVALVPVPSADRRGRRRRDDNPFLEPKTPR